MKIQKLKTKLVDTLEKERVQLIKRILQFVYIKYDESKPTNHVAFFRGITKEILANPQSFDEDDGSDDDSANGEEDEDES